MSSKFRKYGLPGKIVSHVVSCISLSVNLLSSSAIIRSLTAYVFLRVTVFEESVVYVLEDTDAVLDMMTIITECNGAALFCMTA
jgi:hypothetical protein